MEVASKFPEPRMLGMLFGVPQLVEAPLLGRDHEVVPGVCIFFGIQTDGWPR